MTRCRACKQLVCPHPDPIPELARVKAIFQQRAILAAMGINPDQIPSPDTGRGG